MYNLPYEDDLLSIRASMGRYVDQFAINIDYNANSIMLSRTDGVGWGQDLGLVIFNKKTNQKKILMIGPSAINGISIKLDDLTYKSNISFDMTAIRLQEYLLKDRPKIFIALSTIPSRARTKEFIDHLKSLSEEQTIQAEKIFVTIADRYRRFNEISIDENVIEKIKSIDRVELIIMEDMGPACKYLGPLIYKKNEIDNNLLVIVDDDRFYNKNLLSHFAIGFKLFPDIKFAGGNGLLYFSPEYHSMRENTVMFEITKNHTGFAGFYGFCIRVNDIDDIVDFNKKILKTINGAFYHDDGIMRGYIDFKKANTLILNHKACNYIHEELCDALCINPSVDRIKVEEEIFKASCQPGFLDD